MLVRQSLRSLRNVRGLAVTAKQVKALREQTGAPMMDCKKALQESEGDAQKAMDWLRKKGVATASKKAGRATAHGLVAAQVNADLTRVDIVELNSETDFVAKNDSFRQLTAQIATAASQLGLPCHQTQLPIEAVQEAPLDADNTVAQGVTNLVASIRENMQLRRAFALDVPSADSGVLGVYVHSRPSPSELPFVGLKVAATAFQGDLSGLSEEQREELSQVARKVAMHCVVASPAYLNMDEVPADVVDREMAIVQHALDSDEKFAKMPEARLEGVRKGKLQAALKEVCLLQQQLAVDDGSGKKKNVQTLVRETGQRMGVKDLALARFCLVNVGDGVEVQQNDFAAEVAAMASTE